MTKRKKATLPATVYVVREEASDDDDGYLVVWDSIDGIEAGTEVGIYELRDLRTKKVAHSLD